MAYGNYGNGYQQNNYGNNGGYQRNNGGYQQQQPPQQKPFDLTEEINQRLDVYNTIVETIRARGQDPADYAFALGGWATSFALDMKKRQ